MPRANFCVECGERLVRKGWRARLSGRFCAPCARRLGRVSAFRPLIFTGMIAVAAFALGRYLRPQPPPLIIQRAANSPLSDAPVEFARAARPANSVGTANADQRQASAGTSAPGYISG